MNPITKIFLEGLFRTIASPIFIWILIFLFLMILVNFLKPYIKGKTGETAASIVLRKLPKEKYTVLNNIMLQTKFGTTQLDHIVISTFGIFVIETKNYSGLITGTRDAEQWIQHFNQKKYQFQNPIHQNYGHIVALSILLKLLVDCFYNIVAFDNDTELKLYDAQEVIRIFELKNYICRYQTVRIEEKKKNGYVDLIINSNVDSKEKRKEHRTQVHAKKEKYDQSIINHICPKCGGKLIVRTGKYGKFYGCNNYPNCKFTQKI